MTDEQPEQPGKTKRQPPPIGGIQQQSQYATIGGKSSKSQTARPSDVQNAKLSEVQQSESPSKEDTSMPAVETAETPNVKKSKHPGWKQQTVYLPPSLIKWLRVQAPQEEREISEIVEEALNLYRDRMG